MCNLSFHSGPGIWVTAINLHLGDRKQLQGVKSSSGENPIAVVLQFRSFVLNVLPRMPHKVNVVFGINSLILGDKFMAHNPADVKEKHQHALGCAADLTRLVRS